MATQLDKLDEIARNLRILNKTVCCNGGTGGGGGGTFNGEITNPCSDPVNTKLCEFPQLIAKLDELNTTMEGVSITAENIYLEADQINLSTDELESLVTGSNTLLNQIYSEVTRGGACADPQFVQVCNQIDLSATQNTLGNILTQVSAINVNTDTLETLLATTNSSLATLASINTVLNNIKTDTANISTNTATTVTRLTAIDTSLNNVETYTQTIHNLKTTFQPTDCNLNPVGPTVDVLPVTVKNRVDTQLCNVQALADALANAITFPTNASYNTVTQQEVTSGVVTIAANTVHSISYIILAGTVTITIGGVASVYAAGESSEEEASGLINVAYSFAPAAGARVRIKTIKV